MIAGRHSRRLRVVVCALPLMLSGSNATGQALRFEDLTLQPTAPPADWSDLGAAVALQGDVAVVTGSSVHPLVGFVFRRAVDGTWVEEQALPVPPGSLSFGGTVAVSGDVIAFGDDDYLTDPLSFNNGAVFVYRYNGVSWAQEVLLAPLSQGDESFGRGLALSGDLLVAGAAEHFLPGTGWGSVHVYRNVGTSWNLQTVLASDPLFPGSSYGVAVATDGERIVVGDSEQDDFGSQSGAAYVYRYVGGVWMQEARLTASDMLPMLNFGFSVAVDGDTLAVGAPGFNAGAGATYVFRHDGTQWVVEQRLEGDSPITGYALDLELDGDRILVAKSRHAFGTFVTGAAYLYRYQSGQWVHTETLAASNPTEMDFFGLSIALDGERALVGAPLHESIPGVETGAVYMFELVPAEFRRGDVNDDGTVNIADAVAGLAALFSMGGAPAVCPAAADANADGGHDIADAIYTLSSLFVPGAPPPSAPFPDCGPDPSPGGLPCGTFASCP